MMKSIFGEYIKAIMYTVFGLILIMSTYLIIINVHHYNALSSTITVSDVDTNYVNYKKNVNEISKLLNKINSNASLNKTYNVLKQGGLYRIIPNTKLTYHDLYQLNDYFINDILNNCWFSDLSKLNKNKSNDKIIKLLVDNANYLNKHFLDNGLTLYDSVNKDKIYDDYSIIIENYYMFSSVILSMSKGE